MSCGSATRGSVSCSTCAEFINHGVTYACRLSPRIRTPHTRQGAGQRSRVSSHAFPLHNNTANTPRAMHRHNPLCTHIYRSSFTRNPFAYSRTVIQVKESRGVFQKNFSEKQTALTKSLSLSIAERVLDICSQTEDFKSRSETAIFPQ